MSKSIYQQLKDAGCTIDNHCSDLYVKVDNKSRPILHAYTGGKATVRVSYFISQIDGTQWADLPFQYEPYWEAKTKESK